MQWISIRTASELTGKSPTTIRRMIKRSEIKARKDSKGRWEVRQDSFTVDKQESPNGYPPDYITALQDQLKEKDRQIEQLMEQCRNFQILLKDKKLIEHQPEKKLGIFSKALVKFGL